MEPSAFDLDSLSFPALLEALKNEGGSCIIKVTDGIFSGAVDVVQGEIASASFGKLTGAAAVAALMIAEPLRCSLMLEPEAQPPGGSERPTTALGSATLLGLGAPFADSTPARPSTPHLQLRPPSLRPQLPAPAPELRSWAVRTAEHHHVSASSSLERASVTSEAVAVPVRAQQSIAPAVFARDRTLWIAAALCVPLLLAGLYRARSYVSSASTPTPPAAADVSSVSVGPLHPPTLAPGTTPTTLKASLGSLAPTVMVRVLVATDGTVKQVAVQAPRAGLGQLEKQAMDSVRGYRFVPAKRDDKPVEGWLTLPVSFQTAPGNRVLAVKGSETLGATLGPDWAKGLEQTESGLKIEVDALGSSTGIAGLLDGSAAVAMSSRPIRAEELAYAARLGVQLRELVVAYDGIAVIVHPDNPLRNLDLETAARVFSQRLTRWSQLAGPDAPIHALGRPAYSGTHAFLREKMLATLGPGGGFGSGVESLEAPSEVVARVARDVNAIGYVSIGQLTPSVRALALSASANEPAVAATHQTIRDSSYPIARPLFLYLRADSEHDARMLADYALSPAGQARVQSHGFVPVETALTAPLAQEIPAPRVATPELTRVYFRPNSAAIESESRAELAAAVAAMRAGKHALVVGHADSAGKAERNELLAHNRAETVARQLRRFAPAGAVEVEIAAATHPLASNTTADGRKANRRVDLLLQDR